MKTVRAMDDIQPAYSAFLENNHYPKLESLSNWGKNRFFFSLYFKLIEDWHLTEQIVIEMDKHFYRLDTSEAPDFLDEKPYLAWHKGALLHQYAV